MLVYVILFAAALVLRYKKPEVKRSYKIPLGNVGMWIVAIFGISSCIGAIFLGFIPPSQLDVGGLFRFETVLVIGVLGLCIPPFILYRSRASWADSDNS